MPATKHQALVPLNYAAPSMRAVAYVRMSTEHQRYSVSNQLTVLREYATEHSLQLVRTYSDEGISGLTIENRLGLQSLIASVSGGRPDFSKVLVYDISRWGRFQDTDQGAFYEYLCRMNGVDVIYCAEPFQDDQTPLSAMFKAVKRAMAAEYSRELSVKILRALCNLASRGFNPGSAGYGLRNVVVDLNGKVIRNGRLLDRTTIRDIHVMLAPGPAREVRVVKEIFRRYVELDETTTEIAAHLNACGFRTRRGYKWDANHIGRMLVNERYAGTQVYNLFTCKLKSKRRRNDPAHWIRKTGAFKAVVDPNLFQKAQFRRKQELRGPHLSDEELLSRIRNYIDEHGFITARDMLREKGLPGRGCLQHRFGSLARLYQILGYDNRTKSPNWNERRRLGELRSQFLSDIQTQMQAAGLRMTCSSSSRFVVGGRIVCAAVLAKPYETRTLGVKWRIRFQTRQALGLHLIGRLGTDGKTVIDYYVVPAESVRNFPAKLRPSNARVVRRFRARDLAAVVKRFQTMLKPSSISRYG